MTNVDWITCIVIFGLLIYGITAIAHSYMKKQHEGKIIWMGVLFYSLMISIATLVEHLQNL